MRITKKKIVGAVAVSAVVALGAGSAYAFWTTSGSGTGTATVGTNVEFTIAGDVTDELLLDVTRSFDITVSNPAAFPQHLETLTFDIDATSLAAGCDRDWFTLVQPTVVAGDIAANGSQVYTGASITLDNDPLVNQDDCKTDSITLEYTSS